jgi:hypothetical protein
MMSAGSVSDVPNRQHLAWPSIPCLRRGQRPELLGRSVLALILSIALTMQMAYLALAQDQPPLTLLACEHVVPVRNQHAVVQFEREIFPPFSDTGLFVAQGQQLLYVEQGLLTVFDEQIGKGVAQTGDFYLAAPNGPIGVRNDELEEASLLWLRLAESAVEALPVEFLSPNALRALLAPADYEPAGPPPLFIEFTLPESVFNQDALLFLMRMDVAPHTTIDVGGDTSQVTSSGRFAVVVESGSLQVINARPRAVLAGEWTALDGDQPSTIENPGPEPAGGFMVGIVQMTDEGTLRRTMLSDETCNV